MELIDVYDRNGNRTGKVVERGTSLLEGEYILAVGMWIVDSQNRIFLTKRSSEKLPPRYQKMLQNRYVSARKNIAQSQKLQIFPAKSAFCLVVLTCVWYYT